MIQVSAPSQTRGEPLQHVVLQGFATCVFGGPRGFGYWPALDTLTSYHGVGLIGQR